MIGRRAPGAEWPLLMFHDVSWPHARRDTYYAPERIPEEQRQALAHDVCVEPGRSRGRRWAEFATSGRPLGRVGRATGCSPRSRTSSAVATTSSSPWCLCSSVSACYGARRAPWASQVAAIVGPWDRNPISPGSRPIGSKTFARPLGGVRAPGAGRRAGGVPGAGSPTRSFCCEQLLGSKAFSVGDRLTRLRHPGALPGVSRWSRRSTRPSRRLRPRSSLRRSDRSGAVSLQLAPLVTSSSRRCRSVARASPSTSATWRKRGRPRVRPGPRAPASSSRSRLPQDRWSGAATSRPASCATRSSLPPR